MQAASIPYNSHTHTGMQTFPFILQMRGWGKAGSSGSFTGLGLQPGFQGLGSRAEDGAHDASPPLSPIAVTVLWGRTSI